MARLLERDDELSVLAGAVQRAVGGAGSVVLVGGEAGIGKTSLVRALADAVGDRASFLGGACEPLSVPVPLAPWRELLEAAGAGDLEGEDRLLMTRVLLDALRERAPAVAVIEDVHWADPLTLDLVRMVAGRVESIGAVLVMTYRDDEVATNRDLGLLLGDLATNPVVRRIDLRPLSNAAVRTLAAPSGLDVAEVQRVTGGNPFLVVETVAAEGGGLPASVRDAALARAGRLSPAARTVVDAAAIIGQRFDAALLEALAPGSTGEVEEALRRGVLVADGDRLGFRHELMRAAIEGSISPPRRAALHADVLTALTERPGAADSALLAHHAELAGMRAEASRHAIQAALDAGRVGAMREVALQTERAVRLGDGLSAAERLDLLIQQAFAANFAGLNVADAFAPAEQAIALAVEAGDAVRHGRALIARAYALWSMDEVAESQTTAEEAIAVLERAGDVEALARGYAMRVRLAASALDPETAIAEGERTLELAARAGLEETRIDAVISLGLARGHRGELEALQTLRRTSVEARERGLAIPTIRSYVNQVFVGALLRQHAFVESTAREAREVFDQYQAAIPAYAVESYRARSLLDRGRFEEALAVAASREEWAAETPIALAIRGLIASRRGQPGAQQLLSEAWEQLRTVPEGSRHATVRVALAEDAWIRDDRAQALSLYTAARESPAAWRYSRQAGELALWAMRWGWEFERPEQAPGPVLLELSGEWRAAIGAWEGLEAPYEAALAALPGDERAARGALAALHRLGAAGAARAFTRERSTLGARAARGPRPSTLANPAGLTRREQEILEALATGATNSEIAATFHLSERTVAHHVSAILGKLGVRTRLAAVEGARRHGLLPENGTPRPPT